MVKPVLDRTRPTVLEMFPVPLRTMVVDRTAVPAPDIETVPKLFTVSPTLVLKVAPVPLSVRVPSTVAAPPTLNRAAPMFRVNVKPAFTVRAPVIAVPATAVRVVFPLMVKAPGAATVRSRLMPAPFMVMLLPAPFTAPAVKLTFPPTLIVQVPRFNVPAEIERPPLSFRVPEPQVQLPVPLTVRLVALSVPAPACVKLPALTVIAPAAKLAAATLIVPPVSLNVALEPA